MSKILKIKFSNEAGKNVSINIPNINDGVTSDQIKTLTSDIISKGVFTSQNGALKKVISANLVETKTTNFLL
ncbi:hypothetical protein BJV85_003834 [Clostridium acetobutylicum]|uniref:DUF2922 domain-containing protein n=1 Tax=Clostridium acetobutylicum (strain ATCC 824 / DSM 792 / JCM 1419 / IAM 19013 / LMG 5710 / NBRC 13948 / NRRL B-527 / VKM B-1787 / 2291 / W) TaxID=272562 RepID=Q97TE2_CLOAB|nr:MULTISPECIES: DUF2922 domain-containing protein [Clostridium]AAK76915.1 Hypothetical protein, CF-46 family [Clostridium acetobutylicum ATCC 824]ADZ22951.1 Conserved hypothetical protein [Clostridium acetobutylicum EA 2018]AEI34911.1 hypothetical protein SMB_P168 [Clostridium acetobutylicum DSM 1731]AWV82282.1 DUF2922 domain-containing protein [Clostridium acetobutylicum]MBC2396051.1 DUF2922 domain-containing protein [Clostridium acetobutylicum]